MKEKNKTSMIVATIGAIGTIVAGIGGSILGDNYAEKKQEEYIQSQIVQIAGDNNNVTINDIDDLFYQYNHLLDENELLKEKNNSYFTDLNDAKNELDSLKTQLGDAPQILFNDLGLILDAQDVFINKKNSMVTIDGRDYFSKEIIEKLLPDNKNMTIKDNAVFVGMVVTDRENLIGKKVMSSTNCKEGETFTDSYGNTYSNTMYFSYKGDAIYVLDGKYSLMKFTVAVSEDAIINKTGILTIKADDTIVYTSPALTKTTEAFTEMNISIENCKLLTIEYDTDSYDNQCILSDVLVYN